MIASLKIKLRRGRLRLMRWLRDPDLDILGLGVLATLTGRIVLFASVTFSFAAAGLYGPALAMALILSLDTLTQVEVLASLRRLMRYEVVEEIENQFRLSGLEVVTEQ